LFHFYLFDAQTVCHTHTLEVIHTASLRGN